MTEDKYQIKPKAQYLNVLLLKDEIRYFDGLLSGVISDIDNWLTKLRATRGVFLTLNNVKDAADRIQLNGSEEFVEKTRTLRRNLMFANHFRNRGIGHLNDTLLKRAVQWSPQLFYESSRGNEAFQIAEAQRTIIESCINSFIDKEGVQKVFGTEIDLMYPPDAEQFFTYLSGTVHESIDWLTEALAILRDKIEHHTDDEIQELAAIAGQTSFDLKSESDLVFSADEMKARFASAIEALEQEGADPEIMGFLQNRLKI
jgi:hypothetical protein